MLSGGKLIDKGLYGCIFTPPLACKPDTQQYAADYEKDTGYTLSKLIIKREAEIEYNISKVIHQIPLWKNYFVVSESICEPAAVQTDKDLKDCPPMQEHTLSEFRILTMPYGGVPLNMYVFNLRTLNVMDFIIHLIEAGAILTLFGIVHRDIHQGNILVDSSTIPRIIDFNVAVPVKNTITTSTLAHSYEVTTAQEPPDSTLVNAIQLGYKPDRVIEAIIHKKPIMKRIRTLLNIPLDTMLASLELFYTQSKSVKAGDSVKWFQTYWRTIDSWAIGVNIIDLISKLLIWPDFAKTLKKIEPTLFPVLKRMCAVNPLERIDCVQAINYLAPNSFITRKYSKAWLAKVGTGNI